MQILIAALALLLGGANAYVVEAYSSLGCAGDRQEINVYDNTCATWMNGFQSLKMVTVGGFDQNMWVYSRNACAGPVIGNGSVSGWDDEDPPIELSQCYNTVDGAGVANALASYTFAPPQRERLSPA